MFVGHLKCFSSPTKNIFLRFDGQWMVREDSFMNEVFQSYVIIKDKVIIEVEIVHFPQSIAFLLTSRKYQIMKKQSLTEIIPLNVLFLPLFGIHLNVFDEYILGIGISFFYHTCFGLLFTCWSSLFHLIFFLLYYFFRNLDPLLFKLIRFILVAVYNFLYSVTYMTSLCECHH